ncbi:hypothetical protein ASE75_09850 [Sphingomonas sp. Leaf17]|uniref:acyltransferase family protein n=1 Tax=Sphingomonas sp. Leaf17 TaxID=1735683 RepID=UPI0006FCC90A|nr:heparan-alpha-glucosaminide N-acetyltransferase domain-containing protein [Sphingomonas sp. Leaf17]KQM64282.1 hypothetical protein ASE75_09850 [Sphingomonas sp. Leaf17]
MTTHPTGRLPSLDLLRGIAVMGMILVNSAAAIHYDRQVAVPPWLLHAHWNGLTLADLVFPAFLMMMGVAVPMAAAGRGARGIGPGQARRIGGRVIRLVLLGVVLSNLYWFARFDSGAWRPFGVLQRIGLVYGACALLYLGCGRRVRVGLIVAILIGYALLLLVPTPDGVPVDLMLPGRNVAAWVDRWLLGSHRYVAGAAGYDPEGVLGTLPAIAHGLIGVEVGAYLLVARGRAAALRLALAGAAMIAGGLLAALVSPIVKDLWSSSFVLATCGTTTLALGGLHALVDHDGWKPGRAATTARDFGINAVAAYTLHMVTASVVGWDLFYAVVAPLMLVLPTPVAAMAPVLLYMAAIGAAMAWLRRQGWIVKL